MTYAQQDDLANDQEFRGRVRMCVAEQSEVFVTDDRPNYSQLAIQAVNSLETTTDMFVPLVAVRPGMSLQSTDLDILSAVQYVWPLVGARYIPPANPATPFMVPM